MGSFITSRSTTWPPLMWVDTISFTSSLLTGPYQTLSGVDADRHAALATSRQPAPLRAPSRPWASEFLLEGQAQLVAAARSRSTYAGCRQGDGWCR